MCIRDRTKSGNRLAVKKEEIITLKSFLSELLSRKIQMSYLDNFIYGFSIPQISKEFDLLKIYENGPVINIELKSRMIDEKKIEYQLKKNQYYLSHFKKENYQLYICDDRNGIKSIFV